MSEYLSERDKLVHLKWGYGAEVGRGARPAILVIDVTYKFTGDRPVPILEGQAEFPLSCGEEAWEGIAAIKRMLEVARPKGIPVFYTVMTDFRLDGVDAGRWIDKNPKMLEGIARDRKKTEKKGNEVVAEVAPTEQDFVIVKDKPSAFFGTQLQSLLTAMSIDTLLITGTTTSCCVRASVVDGFSYNYRVNIVQEAVFDQIEALHEINLFDMNQKFADVIGVETALEYLNSLGHVE